MVTCLYKTSPEQNNKNSMLDGRRYLLSRATGQILTKTGFLVSYCGDDMSPFFVRVLL